MSATVELPLKPTLWRTCRVLANEVRLRLLREVAERPDQRVSAFTHPRRVLMARLLQAGDLTSAEIRRRAAVSDTALRRHLKKLEERGFVTQSKTGWRLVRPKHPLAAVLVDLANSE
jgi:DNA-binding transcriptional ArsR family regulator